MKDLERLKSNAELIGGDLALLSYPLDMAIVEAREELANLRRHSRARASELNDVSLSISKFALLRNKRGASLIAFP